MIEIWQECSSFLTTSQWLAEQIKIIFLKSWFSDLEVVDIHEKINNQEGNKTVPDTSRVVKEKQPKRNELPTSENGNAT